MGDSRENGMIVVGDCSVDLVVVGGDVRVSMDVVGSYVTCGGCGGLVGVRQFFELGE